MPPNVFQWHIILVQYIKNTFDLSTLNIIIELITFDESPVEELEKLFLHKRFDGIEFPNIIKNIDVSNYILKLDNEELIKLII